MDRITLKSKVSSDGVLHLSLPIGLKDAGQDVQVTVDPIAKARPMSREAWQAWVESMAGTWQGDFERPQQGEYETRESLS